MTGDELPPDPISALTEAAGALHVMFEALLQAGFTESQACRIAAVAMVENGRQS